VPAIENISDMVPTASDGRSRITCLYAVSRGTATELTDGRQAHDTRPLSPAGHERDNDAHAPADRRGTPPHILRCDASTGSRTDGMIPLISSQPETVFATRGLTKVYHMGEVSVHALRGIELELYAGEFVVLLGPSGSGKSTLLNILGGLDVPTSGSVHYRDQQLTDFDDMALTRYRREHVGFVFQFYNLIPSLTARENVALVTDIAAHPMDPSDALSLVNLVDRQDHFPSQLSGGEQQRVAIARAVAKNPTVLLCDEPTGALDVHTGILVLEAIGQVNKSLGTTTAVITHNAVIAEMADRVISISDGRIVHVEQNQHKRAASELKW
jgi:putative ABC transport system ATP-binding protein